MVAVMMVMMMKMKMIVMIMRKEISKGKTTDWGKKQGMRGEGGGGRLARDERRACLLALDP
jgi:hypothetical protein